jgi:hypothetical protein
MHRTPPITDLCCANDAFIYDSATQMWTDLGAGHGNAINASAQVVGVLATAAALPS